MPSRSSLVSKRAVAVSVVFPSCSSNTTVWTEMCPAMGSNSKVHLMVSGRAISRNSPRNPRSTPSEPRCTIRHFPPGRKSISQLAVSNRRGPHQRDMCSHEVCASNTSSRGASNTRVMTNSRSPWVVTVSLLPLAGIAFLLSSSLELLQVLVQPVVALLPEFAVPLDPLVCFLQRPRLQPGRPPLPFPAPSDQPRPLQHLQVLRDRRQAHRERLRELRDRGLARR